MKHVVRPITITLAGLVLAGPLASQDAATRLRVLDRELPAIMDSAGVPGLMLVVLEHGQVAATRSYGVRSLDTKAPVDSATVFEAMSLTKQVVAYLAMRLVEQGTLDLDRPLAQYVPHPDLTDPRSQVVTPRMVLSHTSGLPNWRPEGGALAFSADPGTGFRYSGEGYVWLGMVIEKVTGLPLEEAATQQVFFPLGMTRSSLVWEDRFAADVAVPHAESGPIAVRTTGGPNAAASLRTTGPDYGRFVAALLAPTGLGRATVEMMITPVIDVAPGLQWGTGVGIERGDSGRAFFQWGDNFGYKGVLLVDPDRGTGIAYIANSQSGMSVRDAIVARLMPGVHPALTWSRYDQFNSPAMLVVRRLDEAYRTGGVTALARRYDALRRSEPDSAFNEFQLNTIGYQLLRSGKTKDAIAVFELNVRSYPSASNPFDSLGEAYAADGQVKPAIASYEKSLALDPGNTNAVQALEKLRPQL
jgi:CubicO group peptidase (beta-lactamase class C family)